MTARRAHDVHQAAQFRRLYPDHLRRRDGMPDMKKTQRFDIEKFFAELDQTQSFGSARLPWLRRTSIAAARARRPSRARRGHTSALATSERNRAEVRRLVLARRTAASTDALTDLARTFRWRSLPHAILDALRTHRPEDGGRAPRVTTRAMVRGIVHLPDAYANIIVLSEEVFRLPPSRCCWRRAARSSPASPGAARIEPCSAGSWSMRWATFSSPRHARAHGLAWRGASHPSIRWAR